MLYFMGVAMVFWFVLIPWAADSVEEGAGWNRVIAGIAIFFAAIFVGNRVMGQKTAKNTDT